MVTRNDVLILGLSAGVVGSLIGGFTLGVGMGLIAQGANLGWLLALPGAPLGGLFGLLLARRLARHLPHERG